MSTKEAASAQAGKAQSTGEKAVGDSQKARELEDFLKKILEFEK